MQPWLSPTVSGLKNQSFQIASNWLKIWGVDKWINKKLVELKRQLLS
jgi:hypothetical protein